MRDQGPPTYTFGDSAVAGDRLALVAALFEPSSTALLELAAPSPVASAFDLGCGPGFTTALVARVCRAERTLGLDASASFVERARAMPVDPSISFAVHDVVRTPLPDPPADVIHARFLLAHLPDPAARLQRWSRSLAPGGRLVTDETERIDTHVPAFLRYEALGRAMVERRGADLQVGRFLRDAAPPPGTRLVHSTCCDIRPTTATVARIFAMNFATWRHDPFVTENVSAHDLDALADELDALMESRADGDLVFQNRHVVFEREG